MAAGAGYTRIRSARRRASSWAGNGWSGARAGGLRLVRLEVGGPAGVRARCESVLWVVGGGCAHVKGAEVQVQCKCSARCQTSVTGLTVECPGAAQLLGGADVGRGCTALGVVGDETAGDSSSGSGRETWTAHQWPARDLTQCGWAETAMAGNSSV
jgi:hypothetical protein